VDEKPGRPTARARRGFTNCVSQRSTQRPSAPSLISRRARGPCVAIEPVVVRPRGAPALSFERRLSWCGAGAWVAAMRSSHAPSRSSLCW
jgi:hypothetical protein